MWRIDLAGGTGVCGDAAELEHALACAVDATEEAGGQLMEASPNNGMSVERRHRKETYTRT